MTELSLVSSRVERRLMAVFAADVAGYSRLVGADEEGTLAQWKAHWRELITPKIAEHRGRIVRIAGDGLLLEFASAVAAVRCAVEIQRAMVERNTHVPQQRRIEFRIGINVGDIIVDGSDMWGDGVNVAARLEALAEPGGICISGRVQEDVHGRVDVAFDDMGGAGSRTSHIWCESIARDQKGLPKSSDPRCRIGHQSPYCLLII